MNKNMTGTWVEGERRLGDGSVIVDSGEQVLVSFPSKTGWEHVGRMSAYLPIAVGEPMSLINLDPGEGLTTSKITSATPDGDGYILTNVAGTEFRVDVLESKTHAKTPNSSVVRLIERFRGMLGV